MSGEERKAALAFLEDPTQAQVIEGTRLGALLWTVPGHPEFAVWTPGITGEPVAASSPTITWTDAEGRPRSGQLVRNLTRSGRVAETAVDPDDLGDAERDEVALAMSTGMPELLGAGAHNAVLVVPGRSDVVVRVPLDPHLGVAAQSERADVEIEMLNRLRSLGLPSLSPRRIRWTDPTGRPRVGIVMDRVHGAHSNDVEVIDSRGYPVWRRYVTERTLRDAIELLTIAERYPFAIGDFQFMIARDDGALTVVDPNDVEGGRDAARSTFYQLAELASEIEAILDGELDRFGGGREMSEPDVISESPLISR